MAMTSPSSTSSRASRPEHSSTISGTAWVTSFKRAREDAYFLAAFVHLDAGTVELELETRLAELLQRRIDAFGRLGEHGLQGTEELEVEGSQPLTARMDGSFGHGRDVACEHGRPAHFGGGDVEGLGQGIGHDALEGSLA